MAMSIFSLDWLILGKSHSGTTQREMPYTNTLYINI